MYFVCVTVLFVYVRDLRDCVLFVGVGLYCTLYVSDCVLFVYLRDHCVLFVYVRDHCVLCVCV